MGSTPTWGTLIIRDILMILNKILKLLKSPNLFKRIWNKIFFYFYLDQWVILIKNKSEYPKISWEGFKLLLPPKDRFWADPFVWFSNKKYYLFIEEFLYSKNRGTINCISLDEDMNIISNKVILEKPYHLSYPFIFEYENEIYMIPETKQNKKIELYHCVNFPNQWEYVKSLMENVQALDTTLLKIGEKWWMFVNIQEDGGSSWDTLHLYFSDSPISSQWEAHPLNPIVKDVHSARPAGRMFFHEGKIIRPSQDCSVRYGLRT